METTLDITQVNRSYVARETGTDLAHISRIFSHQSLPSITLATRIARVLDITVDDLCEVLGIDPTEDLQAIQDTRAKELAIRKQSLHLDYSLGRV